MSEDFDREAEREKLRQQYEAEEEARQSTQRMSELLLKGATMTNMHCEDCGDPIFRHEGREFCPTCGRVVADATEDEADETDERAGAVESAVDSERAESAEPAADADQPSAASEAGQAPDAAGDADGPRSAGAADRTAAADRGGTAPARDATGTSGPGEVASPPDVDGRDSETPPAPRAGEGGDTTPKAPPASAGRVAGDDLGESRAALVRTLTALAREAEASDDLSRTRDLLAAAREAAEALAALEAARR